jgi:hypothetical protein
MECPECIVGELKWVWVKGIGQLMWECADIGRGWNTNYPERSVAQYGYCGIALSANEINANTYRRDR